MFTFTKSSKQVEELKFQIEELKKDVAHLQTREKILRENNTALMVALRDIRRCLDPVRNFV